MTLPYLIAAIIPFGYQMVSCAASLRFLFRRVPEPRPGAPVSILKPVCGLDEAFAEAIESHAKLDYPEYEILFGVHSMDDPAVPAIQRLIAAHPEVSIRLIHSAIETPNAKTGTLIELARQARYPILLVNDSDVTVPRDYLRRLAAPLKEDPRTGVVTCVFRAVASSPAGRWEAFGISIDFMPAALVAQLVGVREFGFGSTLCFRREDLEAIGGFEAIADYVADDYQLSQRIVMAGKRVQLSEVVVETHLSDPSFAAVWRHQQRWARTIRVSRMDGYAGLPVTHAGVWMIAFLLLGQPWIAAAVWAARAMAACAAGAALKQTPAMAFCWAAPLWDVWSFVMWVGGWLGDTVEWRGKRYRLTRDGKLERVGVSE
jgi:ceramide glucosyltransferase